MFMRSVRCVLVTHLVDSCSELQWTSNWYFSVRHGPLSQIRGSTVAFNGWRISWPNRMVSIKFSYLWGEDEHGEVWGEKRHETVKKAKLQLELIWSIQAINTNCLFRDAAAAVEWCSDTREQLKFFGLDLSSSPAVAQACILSCFPIRDVETDLWLGWNRSSSSLGP